MITKNKKTDSLKTPPLYRKAEERGAGGESKENIKMTITKNSLKTYLNTNYSNPNERNHSLENWLIRVICQRTGYSAQGQLNDIVTHGCISGCVGELIYYGDCIEFYIKYEKQIWELIYNFMQNTGQMGQFIDSFRLQIEDETSLKVNLSWFAIEQISFQLISNIEEA